MALPAYGAGRSTYDLDIAIEFKTQNDIDNLLAKLRDHDVQTAQKPKLDHLVFVVFQLTMKDEAEIWLQPCSGFPWDDLIISRISSQKMEPFSYHINILSTEDFIMTKLGRQDRSVTDLQDVIQIILAQQSIDWKYLIQRAKKYHLLDIIKNLVEKIQKNIPEYKFPDF